jgi:hypothetical protein
MHIVPKKCQYRSSESMLMMLADTGLVQRFSSVHPLLTRNSMNLCNNLSDPSQGEGSGAHRRDDAAVIAVGQIAVLHAWIHRTPVYDEAPFHLCILQPLSLLQDGIVNHCMYAALKLKFATASNDAMAEERENKSQPLDAQVCRTKNARHSLTDACSVL